jgi:hypothetical protein
MKSKNSYSISLICQQGELEIKSILLVYSLLENLKDNFEINIRITKNSPPSQSTLSIFKKLKCKISYIAKPPIDDYAISNKIIAFDYKTSCTHKVFLDSDILALNNFSFPDIQTDYASAVVGILSSNIMPTVWTTLYKRLDIKFRKSPLFDQTNDDLYFHPYYNSGLIIIKMI